MTHLTEQEIEKYLHFTDQLTEREKQRYAHHLEQCASCRSLAQWLSEFGDILQNTEVPDIDGVADEHEAPIIYLESYRATSSGHSQPLVLAADSATSPQRFEELAVYRSSNEAFTIRLLADYQQQTIRLYAIGEGGASEPHLIVFPSLDLTILTNAEGKAAVDFQTLDPDQELNNLNPELHRPTGQSTITLFRDQQLLGEKTIDDIQFRWDDQHTMTVHHVGEEPVSYATRYILLEQGENRTLVATSELPVQESISDIPTEMQLYFFP